MAPRGRGRGKAGGANGRVEPGNSSQDTQAVGGAGPGTVQPIADEEAECACGMCGVLVADSGIGCDRCSEWFHPTEMCTGLPQEAISLIAAHQTDNSVLFVCTGCRVNPGTGSWTKAGRGRNSDQEAMIKQLYLTVKGLCGTVASLTSKFDTLIEAQRQQGARQASLPNSVSQGSSEPITQGQRAFESRAKAPILPHQEIIEYRTMIRQEVKELREREKRKDSIVVRGLTSTTLADVTTEFEEISSMMIGSSVTLTDIVRIPDHPELYRAKILDEGKRKLILEKAKTLKGSRYDGVFIRRDLTYAQRQELKMRRERQLHETGLRTQSGHNSTRPPNSEGRGHQISEQQPSDSDARGQEHVSHQSQAN